MRAIILERFVEASRRNGRTAEETEAGLREGAVDLCDFIDELYPDELQDETLSCTSAKFRLAAVEQASCAVLAGADGHTGPMVAALECVARLAAGMAGGLPASGEVNGKVVYEMLCAIHVYLCDAIPVEPEKQHALEGVAVQ